MAGLLQYCAFAVLCVLLGACKDTAKSSKATPMAPTKMTQAQDPALENLEHKIDDAKTTQRLERIIDTENAIQDATRSTGPMFTPQSNNILQNWNNHEDNLSSPLNHNY
ncbi:hypothetical protein [Helicobacter cynogastricus]|uniref:hypothetical protein n=1 Tax=Helicobacter cynogastricus TaxID=329937 RepID=UPI000CF0DA5B|nr:hypothetical protein [Helicobacter cynogastricus]